MPLQQCQISGKRGWRWGNQKCFTGRNARVKALRQAAAIRASGFTENEGEEPNGFALCTVSHAQSVINQRKKSLRTQIVPSNPLKADPTRTTMLRKRFERDFRKRFDKLKGKIIRLIEMEDAFGLKRKNQKHIENAGEADEKSQLRQDEIHADLDSCSASYMPTSELEYLRIVEEPRIENAGEPLLSKQMGTDFQSKVGENPIPHFSNQGENDVLADARGSNTQLFNRLADEKPSTGPIENQGEDDGIRTRVTFERTADNDDLTDHAGVDSPIRDETRLAENQGENDERERSIVGTSFSIAGSHRNHSPVENTRWRALSTPEQVEAFNRWLKTQVQRDIVTGVAIKDIDDAYWQQYIEEGYRKGAGRAFDDTRKAALASDAGRVSDFYEGTKEEFLRSSFGRPVAIEKVKLLAGRVLTDLQGVNADMATRMSRALTDGLVQGQNPRTIARTLTGLVEGNQRIGKRRAELIARTEIIRAHAEGQLDALENLGVTEVGVVVEWSTAGDDRVCLLCQPLEGTVMKIKEARSIIPRHPSCRCVWVPANVGESTKDQQRSQTAVKARINDSIRATIPQGRNIKGVGRRFKDPETGLFTVKSKRTLAKQKELSKWVGADKTIAKQRPKSILRPTEKLKPKPIVKPGPVVSPTKKKVAPKPPAKKVVSKLDPRKSKLQDITKKDAELDRLQQQVAQQAEKTKPVKDKIEKEIASLGKEVKSTRDVYRKQLINHPKDAATIFSETDAAKKLINDIDKTAVKQRSLKKRLNEVVDIDRKNVARVLELPKEERMVLNVQTAKGEQGTKKITERYKREVKSAEDFLSKMTRKRQDVSSLNETPAFLTPANRRSYYDQGLGGIFVADSPNASTEIIHELGHSLEKKLQATKRMREFRTVRIKRAGTPDVKMAKVFPRSGYTGSEVGNEDDWTKLFGEKKSRAFYVGKDYGERSTEVLSMGVEELHRDPVGFATKDPEFFKTVIGVLRGNIL